MLLGYVHCEEREREKVDRWKSVSSEKRQKLVEWEIKAEGEIDVSIHAARWQPYL